MASQRTVAQDMAAPKARRQRITVAQGGPFAEVEAALAVDPLEDVRETLEADPFADVEAITLADPFAEIRRLVEADPFAEVGDLVETDPFAAVEAVLDGHLPEFKTAAAAAVEEFKYEEPAILPAAATSTQRRAEAPEIRASPVVQLRGEEMKLARELAEIPVEQATGIVAMSQLAPEQKEAVLVGAALLQENPAVDVNEALLDERMTATAMAALWQTLAKNKSRIAYFLSMVTVTVMVAIVIAAATSSGFGAAGFLNMIWSLLGWRGLTLVQSMALEVGKTLGVDLGTKVAFEYVLQRLGPGLKSRRVLPERTRETLRSMGISEAMLNSTYADLGRSALPNIVSLARAGLNIQEFAISKGIGLAVNVASRPIETARNVLNTGANLGAGTYRLARAGLSSQLRRFNAIMATVPQTTQDVLEELEDEQAPGEVVDANMIASLVAERMEPALESLEEKAQLVTEEDVKVEQAREELAEQVEEETELEEKTRQTEIRSTVTKARTAAAIAAASSLLIGVLLGGQIDLLAQKEAVIDLLTQQAGVMTKSAAAALTKNAAVVAGYVENQLKELPIVRRIVFSALLSSTGFPRLLTKMGKFMTVDQLGKLKLLQRQLLTASDREKPGILNAVSDVLLGRFYTAREMSTMTREQIASILSQQGVQVPAGARVETLRRMLRERQKDKQAVTYSALLGAFTEQAGSVATTMALERQVASAWDNREAILEAVNNTKLPFYDEASPFFIPPEQRTALNMMMQSKDFVAQNIAQGATGMYHAAADNVSAGAVIALERVNAFMTYISSTGIATSQPVVNPSDLAEAIQAIRTQTQGATPSTQVSEAVMIDQEARAKLHELSGELRAASTLNDLASSRVQTQMAKTAAIQASLQRYSQAHAGAIPSTLGEAMTAETLAESIARLREVGGHPISTPEEKATLLSSLKGELSKTPSEFHRDQTREMARMQKESFQQGLRVAQAKRTVEEAAGRHEAIQRATQRLAERRARGAQLGQAGTAAAPIALAEIPMEEMQRYLEEMKAELEKIPAGAHAEATRAAARATATAHREAVRERNVLREEAKGSALESRDVRMQHRLKMRAEAVTLEQPGTVIVGEQGAVPVPKGHVLTNPEVLEAWKYEFTPLLRKGLKVGADAGLSYIPGVGMINGVASQINAGLDMAETTKDVANILLQVNAALPAEQATTAGSWFDSLRGALPTQLPNTFNQVLSWRLPTLGDALGKIVDVPKVNLKDILYESTIKGITRGWSKMELATEVATRIAGEKDIETINQIAQQVYSFVSSSAMDPTAKSS